MLLKCAALEWMSVLRPPPFFSKKTALSLPTSTTESVSHLPTFLQGLSHAEHSIRSLQDRAVSILLEIIALHPNKQTPCQYQPP